MHCSYGFAMSEIFKKVGVPGCGGGSGASAIRHIASGPRERWFLCCPVCVATLAESIWAGC